MLLSILGKSERAGGLQIEQYAENKKLQRRALCRPALCANQKACVAPDKASVFLIITIIFIITCGLQIEQHAEIRKELASPQKGELPLPQGLPQKMVQMKLTAVEDINVVVPDNAQQLSSQGLNEHVSLACPLLLPAGCMFLQHPTLNPMCLSFGCASLQTCDGLHAYP